MNEMKNFRKIFKFAFAMVLACNIGTTFFAQTIRTVGSGGNYTTVASAFSAINNGTLTGTIELQIISNITETTTAKLNASGTLNPLAGGTYNAAPSNYTSVTIYPTVSNLIISGSPYTLIEFNGSDNITIDGRVNRTGTTKSLTIENTRRYAGGGINDIHLHMNTILINNSATNNTIQYCVLKGASYGGTATSYNLGYCRRVHADSSNLIQIYMLGGGLAAYAWCEGSSKLDIGNTITGMGLPANTYVTEIKNGTDIRISTSLPVTWSTGVSTGAQNLVTVGNLARSGIVNFGNSLPSGDGNDNNIVSNCDFTNSGGNGPRICVNSRGNVNYNFATSSNKTMLNDNNSVTNCNFYDFFLSSTGNSFSRAINLDQYTNNSSITGNSFYHTSNFTVTGPTTSSFSYSCIFAQINIGNGNVNVTDNFIGGSAPQCGGASNMVFTAAASGQQYGVTLINLAGVGSGSTPTNSSTSTVDRNTIKRISVDYTTLANNPFFVAITTGNNTGRCHIRDNIIGSDSENNSIVISNRSSAGNYAAHGISSGSCPFGGGDNFISGNKIGGIKVDNPSDATKGRSFVAINTTAGCVNAQNLYVRKNIIGSETLSNSIDLANINGASQVFTGIVNNINSCTYIIDSNVIANINNSSSIGTCTGMTCISSSAHYTINQNTIRNIKANSAFTGIDINRSASGNTTTTIRGNTIVSISSDNASAAVTYYGISLALGIEMVTQNIEVSNNFIANFSLNLSNLNSSSEFTGVRYNVGRFSPNYATTKAATTNFVNNIISLGSNISSNCAIYGIYELQWDAVTTNMYNNTINVTGASPSGSAQKTYCIFKTLQTTNSVTANNLNGTRNIRNNIFNNTRSISGGAFNTIHYSLQLISNATTVDYNNHYVSSTGSGNFRAVLGSTDYTDIASWRTALTTSRENNSLNVDPQFANASGSIPQNYTKSVVTNGVSIATITTDYFAVQRENPPQMGAIELPTPIPLPVELSKINAKCHGTFNEINWTTASEHNSSHFNVERTRDGYLWDLVATAEAAGNSNTLIEYSVQDLYPNAGINYYRIVQFDFDGAKETFDPVSVSCDEDIDGVFLNTYPNPGSGDFIVELSNSKFGGDGILQICDVKGSIILENIVQLHKGKNNFYFSNPHLKSGLYYIVVKDKYNKSFTCKYIVN